MVKVTEKDDQVSESPSKTKRRGTVCHRHKFYWQKSNKLYSYYMSSWQILISPYALFWQLEKFQFYVHYRLYCTHNTMSRFRREMCG
jgi:hypothetical protein